MEQARKRYHNQNSSLATKDRRGWGIIGLASSGEYTKISCRPNIQMKAFLVFATTAVFMFSTAAGVAFHAVADMQVKRQITVHLLNMPIKDLAKYDI